MPKARVISLSVLTISRLSRGKCVVHKLSNIVALAIIAVACGEDTWEDIADFAEENLEMLRLYLDLPKGVPSHDTFDRVFRHLNPNAFERVFQDFTADLAKAGKARGIDPQLTPLAVDGKTLRRSFDDAERSSAVHMVSAWCGAQGLHAGPDRYRREEQRDHGNPAVDGDARPTASRGHDRRDELPDGDRENDPRGKGPRAFCKSRQIRNVCC